jgi:prevent-host-death family protein
MDRVWQLQEAKNKFSELVEYALSDGPQLVTRRGVTTVVILSQADYVRLKGSEERLSDFFARSPLEGVDLERDKSLSREVIL